jgi:hypothetical protein
MPRVCTICTHPQRAEIDEAAIAGASYRNIAKQFAVGYLVVMRHKADHLLPELVKSKHAEEVAQADDLLSQLLAYRRRADALLDKTEQGKDYRNALGAIREARSCLELEARLRHELDEHPRVSVLLAGPEWIAIFAAIRRALLTYPGALAAVDQAVALLEEGEE